MEFTPTACHTQDLLQLLLETDVNESETEGASGDGGLSDQQVVGQAIEFLMSGQETTAAGLSSVSYQLALHTQVQDRVQEEMDAFFKKRPVSIYTQCGVIQALTILPPWVNEYVCKYSEYISIQCVDFPL